MQEVMNLGQDPQFLVTLMAVLETMLLTQKFSLKRLLSLSRLQEDSLVRPSSESVLLGTTVMTLIFIW